MKAKMVRLMLYIPEEMKERLEKLAGGPPRTTLAELVRIAIDAKYPEGEPE